MCALIEENLDLCGVPEESTEVVKSEAAEYLRRTVEGGGRDWRGGSEAWDIAFFDPPYATDYAPALNAFGEHAGTLLRDGGLLVVEHHHKNNLRDDLGDARWRILKQGDSALSFYERSVSPQFDFFFRDLRDLVCLKPPLLHPEVTEDAQSAQRLASREVIVSDYARTRH